MNLNKISSHFPIFNAMIHITFILAFLTTFSGLAQEEAKDSLFDFSTLEYAYAKAYLYNTKKHDPVQIIKDLSLIHI